MNNKSTKNYRHNTRLTSLWSALSSLLNFERNSCLHPSKSFLEKKKKKKKKKVLLYVFTASF